MKKIGNVFYKDSLVNHNKVDYIEYICDEEKVNYETLFLPTLVVGWDYFNKLDISKTYPKVSILEKEVNKSVLYWEFSFNENKSEHVSGVDMFVRNVPHYYFTHHYRYKLIDPVFNNIDSFSDLLNKLPHTVTAKYFYKDDMAYLLDGKTIYGIDLKMFEFFDIENLTTRLFEEIEMNDQLNVTLDDDGDIFTEYNEIYRGYEYLKRYMVVLLSK